MKFIAVLAATASAIAIKALDPEVFESGPLSFEAGMQIKCHDCEFNAYYDDDVNEDGWREVMYCPTPQVDEATMQWHSQGCEETYDASGANHYCSWCDCSDDDEGRYNCNSCWYCIEGETSPYTQQQKDFMYCEYIHFYEEKDKDYYGGDMCVENKD